MNELTQQDFENVSIFAHHIGLKALFGVLTHHQPTLAADVALELGRAQSALPRIMSESPLQPHIDHQLQQWIDALTQSMQART